MIDNFVIEDFIKANSNYEVVDIEDCGDGEFYCIIGFDCGNDRYDCKWADKNNRYICNAFDEDTYITEDECPAGHAVQQETVRLSELIRNHFHVESYEHSEVWNSFMVFANEPI